MKEDFFVGEGGGAGRGGLNFFGKGQRGLPTFWTDEGSRGGLSKNSVDVGRGILKKFAHLKNVLCSPCSIHNECSLSIALKNR